MRGETGNFKTQNQILVHLRHKKRILNVIWLLKREGNFLSIFSNGNMTSKLL